MLPTTRIHETCSELIHTWSRANIERLIANLAVYSYRAAFATANMNLWEGFVLLSVAFT